MTKLAIQWHQPEMMPLVDIIEREYNAAQQAVRDAENERWEHWGRVGTLNRETIRRMAFPKWQWDDYSI